MPRVSTKKRAVSPKSTVVNIEWRPKGRHIFRAFQVALRDVGQENFTNLLRWDRHNNWTQKLTLAQWEQVRFSHRGMLHEFILQEVVEETVIPVVEETIVDTPVAPVQEEPTQDKQGE